MASTLSAQQVDPRDVRMEQEVPVYRVYFVDAGGATDEYRLTDAGDVAEVLEWATVNARGRGYSVYVETEGSTGRRLDRIRVAV